MIRIHIWVLLFTLPFISFSNRVYAVTYFVSKQGNDNNDGTTWTKALLTIQRARPMAVSGDSIWVGEGTYLEGYPIIISAGVSFYGGFSGTENNISERNISSHPTIIDGNNSYQCVSNKGYIDGFCITAGVNFVSKGGGIYNYKGTITNCTIYSNWAPYGGGVYNDHGTITKCMVYSNSTTNNGGGIYNWGGAITNCTAYSNSAYDGGGIFNSVGTTTNCTVYSNSAYDGGGFYNDFGKIINCTTYSNSASWVGGGIYNRSGTITNCTVYSNSSSYETGGIYNSAGTITNCTVYSNSSSYTGGIYNSAGTITNCIIWNHKNMDVDGLSGVSYSCFGESDGNNGNIKMDPLFVNVAGGISIWDFHLKNNSPCIDSGTSISAPLFDIEGTRRPQGLDFDMGAYESTKQFSYNAHFISLSAPDLITTGRQFQVTVVTQNTGIETWTNAEDFYLGILANPANLWGIEKVPLLDTDSIIISGTKSFTFIIQAPQTIGVYNFQCQMLKGTQTWFGEMSDMVQIEVAAPIDTNTIKDYLCGRITFDSRQLKLSDYNNDGIVNVADIITILKNNL